MKKIILLSCLVLLSGCRQYELVDEIVDCTNEYKSAFKESFSPGIMAATAKKEVLYSRYPGTEWKVESSSITEVCSLSKCQPGHIMVDLSDKVPYVGRLNSVCIPSPSECQDVTFTGSMESDLYTETLNDLFTYSVKNTPECREENQLECSEDESIKMGDIPSCVPTVVACSGDDLLEGVLSGTKSFLPLMSDYGNCQISACSEGYSLQGDFCSLSEIHGCADPVAANYVPGATAGRGATCTCQEGFTYTPGADYGGEHLGGTCTSNTPPPAITGCMAPGAVNFNPEATIEGECSCSIGFFYDDAQNVCLPNQTVCDEFSYFDTGLNACILN